MNSTMKWSLLAAVGLLAALVIAAVIMSKPATAPDPNTDIESTTNQRQGAQLNEFNPRAEPVEELQTIDLVAGDGAVVEPGATVTAHYTGALVENGVIFESSHERGEPFTAPLSNLIAGWQQGIPGMREGGTRRLIIPAELAYGAQGTDTIPPNADLVFDIELITVQNQ